MAGVPERRELTEDDLRIARLPPALWQAKLSTSTLDCKATLVKVATDFRQFLIDGYGLILFGPNGCGKSSAAAAFVKEASRLKFSVIWLTAQQVIDLTFSKEKMPSGVPLSTWVEDVDMLVIDDLGKEHLDAGGFAHRKLEQLLRVRCMALKSTFMTTNMTPAQLKEQYKASMFEVMRGRMSPLKCEGENRRAAQANALDDLLA